MQLKLSAWIKRAVIAAVLVSLLQAGMVHAQHFKTPLNLSQFVHRPGEDLARVEHLQGWTFGLGTIIGLEDRDTFGLLAHVTFGGPYWYVAGGVGTWQTGDHGAGELAYGLSYHYNALQSGDYRTRLGPQFGWSSTLIGDDRAHSFNYGVVVSHSPSPTLSLYGGLGAETYRLSANGDASSRTYLSMLAGLRVGLGKRFGLSSGLGAVRAEPRQLSFASSVQYEAGYGEKRARIR